MLNESSRQDGEVALLLPERQGLGFFFLKRESKVSKVLETKLTASATLDTSISGSPW